MILNAYHTYMTHLTTMAIYEANGTYIAIPLFEQSIKLELLIKVINFNCLDDI